MLVYIYLQERGRQISAFVWFGFGPCLTSLVVFVVGLRPFAEKTAHQMISYHRRCANIMYIRQDNDIENV